MMDRRRKHMGFTMIETLVALSVAAVVLHGFYTALSTGSLLDRRASLQAQKMFVATNVLDQVGIDIPLRGGVLQTGQTQGFDWELVISSAPPRDMQLGTIYQNELTYVSVSVVDPADPDLPAVVVRSIRYNEDPL